MTNRYILALDQGTTSSRSILFDQNGGIKASAQQDFEQLFPQTGWVEHHPQEIWTSQLNTMKEVVNTAGISTKEIAAIGITNQRETTLIWDRKTGKPIYNAIVWQDRRTAEYCDFLKAEGHLAEVKSKTGLLLDAYFSATKIKWILDHVPDARSRAEEGELCFGTMDSWLIWNLTGGETYITDVTNASRTMLFNIHSLEWDDSLLELFQIPRALLPEVKECSEIYGNTSEELLGNAIPIAGIAGDQQAALFGQLCVEKGMVKNTYGTGCFLLMNTGEEAVVSSNNLLTTVAWTLNGITHYALEGSVFIGGAAVQWIRDGLEMINDASEIEELARTVSDNGGVYFVPALSGLGAPHWDPYARGGIFGLTRGTRKGHIARATLEGIAFQVLDVVQAMEEDANAQGTELRVDGGAAANDLLLQIQADLFNFKVIRPKMIETTALGAAYLAGLAVGFWDSLESLKSQWEVDVEFYPSNEREAVNKSLIQWRKAVERCSRWSQSGN